MYPRLRLVGVIGVGALVTLFALLPVVGAGAAARTALTKVVSITSTTFNPKTVTVNVGDTVTWKNTLQQAQTVTADNGSFDSGNIAPGQTFSHTFAKVGTFAYRDKNHSGMRGTVVVRGPSRLPKTGEGEPDRSGYVLIVAVLSLAGGLVLRYGLRWAGH